jgi:hypothetical protein
MLVLLLGRTIYELLGFRFEANTKHKLFPHNINHSTKIAGIKDRCVFGIFP